MMKNEITNPVTRLFIMSIAIGSIILISFMIYKDMLNYILIGSDAFTFIEKCRIESVEDITRIFSEAVFEGTAFSEIAKFYRPVLVSLYGLDYSIWQLNPFGYHLTDLILHISVSVLVFFFVLFLTNGKKAVAWLSAVIFTVHPIHIKILPATASSRQEITFTLFILIAFLTLFKYHRMVPRKSKYLFLPLLFYLLALGCKETAIIFVPLILTYLLIFYYVPEKSVVENLIIAIKQCSLIIIATVIYLAWRTYVLDGLGGYDASVKPSDFNILVYLKIIIYIIISYFEHLLLPMDFLKSQGFSSFSKYSKQIIFFVFALSIPLLFLLNKLSNFIKLKDLKQLFAKNHAVKLIFFSIIWLLFPLSLSLFLKSFSVRYLYVSVIPFSIILSTLCIIVIQTTTRRLKESANSGSTALLIYNIGLSSFIFLLMLCGLIAYTPSTRAMDKKWGHINKLNIIFIHRFKEIINDIPDGSDIHLHNVPLIGLHTYTIQSWLNLTHPYKNITADIVRPRQKKVKSFKDLRFELENEQGKEINMNIIYAEPKE